MTARRWSFLETGFGRTVAQKKLHLGGVLVLVFLLFFHWAKRNVISVGTRVSFAHPNVVIWGFVQPKRQIINKFAAYLWLFLSFVLILLF